MPTDFFLCDPVEHRPVIVAHPRLEMVNEERTDSPNEDPKWNVDDPMDAKVENCETKQQGIDQNKAVVFPVMPIP